MSPRFPSLIALLLLLLAAGLTAGCQARSRPVSVSTVDVRTQLRLDSSPGGTRLTWSEFIDQAAGVDIIVLGEEHDDATGHAVQLAVVEDLLDRRGGGSLAMEMLERDEQLLVDDHADGILDAQAFATATRSSDWAGEGSWVAWYQPIIKATLERDGRVIAANAPRRYVRLARIDGWEAVETLPPERGRLVEVPPGTIDGVYQERFMEIMGGHDGNDEEPPTEEEIAMADSFYLAQQVWDATMADSVASEERKL